MIKLSFRFRCLLGVFGLGLSAYAQPTILEKARAYLGSENALSAVDSLRFIGELEIVDVGQTVGGIAKIEIIFQKPNRQRITATSKSRSEITALDGYDAWQRVTSDQDPSRWQVNLLGSDQIKRLRANTFENLAFYRGLEQWGGHVEDRGEFTVDGVVCHKFAFVHCPGIVFTRSFEVATGRLVLTETESGTQIREEGEIRSGELRFPQRMTTNNSLRDGNKRIIRVTFSSVEVNPQLDVASFAIPTLRE
jgi:outer membrane lipoprotein-sorting protein